MQYSWSPLLSATVARLVFFRFVGFWPVFDMKKKHAGFVVCFDFAGVCICTGYCSHPSFGSTILSASAHISVAWFHSPLSIIDVTLGWTQAG
jgi:hypothetical protein